MPVHIPIADPTKDQALEAMSKLPLNGKDKNCRTKTISSYVKLYGPLTMYDARGDLLYYASYQQTITMVPNANLVLEVLREKYTETDERAFTTLRACIEKLASNSWPGFFKKLDKEMMGELSVAVEVLDTTGDGGMIPLYGKPTFGIRGKLPDPGKHHTVMPGTLPLTSEAA